MYLDEDFDGKGTARYLVCLAKYDSYKNPTIFCEDTNNNDVYCDNGTTLTWDTGEVVENVESDIPDVFWPKQEFVEAFGDCDDSDKDLVEENLYWPDKDGDGYGQQGAQPITYCSNDDVISLTDPSNTSRELSYSSDSTDCDDNNPTIHPTAVETQGDNIDKNCNGNNDI